MRSKTSFIDAFSRGLTRRGAIKAGCLSAFGLTLPSLLHAREIGDQNKSSSFGKAKSCIILFMLGGPPQHETWDPKPDAPREIRGDFGCITTRTPGVQVGELMPRTAAMTDKIAILRAMATDDNAHSSSGYWMLTGRPHAPKNQENALPGPLNDWPSMGAAVRRIKGDRTSLPGAIRLPEEIWNTGRLVWPGQDAGWLGNQADPWLLACDPNDPAFRVPDITLPDDLTVDRYHLRQSMRALLGKKYQQLSTFDSVRNWNQWQSKANDLLQTADATRAFDLEKEGSEVRDRYGRNRFGQSVLLARRLVQSGVSLVQVNWTRWATDTTAAPAWDTHAKNSERLKDALMPPMDQAYSALLEDLSNRGMLDETLVVWMGEFGRTPKINAAGGRDHWGHVFSVALAGGGINGGVVHGQSDRDGGFPIEGRVEPQDLCSTIFHCLGIPKDLELHDSVGRPFVASQGNLIEQVLV
jgi:hypothetical protein